MTKHEILQTLIKQRDRASKNASTIEDDERLRSYYSGFTDGLMQAIRLIEDELKDCDFVPLYLLGVGNKNEN